MGKHKGFTLIEIALFLAVTAALFIGIALGMQNAIFQQRYNDSVQSFFDFMRSIYSKVSNPQSPASGNSNLAIYGKLVVFGQTMDMNGATIDPADGHQVFTYDVVGDVATSDNMGTGDVAALLKRLNVNAVIFTRNASNAITGARLASPEKFVPRWGASIEPAGMANVKTKFTGSILVVRHPRSGTINTLFLNRTIEVNSITRNANASRSYGAAITNMLTQYLGTSGTRFTISTINFCVDPYGESGTGSVPRQNIRVLDNARNASSVQLIEMDGGDNACIK